MIAKQANKSFSLIELLMSIAITMIIACMLIPRMSVRPDQILEQELEKFETLFYALQQRAIAQGRDLRLSFDLEHQGYSYQTIHGKAHQDFLSKEVCFGVIPETFGPPWQATELVKIPTTFKNIEGRQTVVFYSHGKISSGTIYLCDKNKAVGGALTCAVSQVFYIRRYLYKDKQWKLINSQ